MFALKNPRKAEWITENVYGVAMAIRHDPKFSGYMSILADAMEEGGYQDQFMLAHCRDKRLKYHHSCCHVLNYILGSDERFSSYMQTLEVNYDILISDLVASIQWNQKNSYITDVNFPKETWESGKKEQTFTMYLPTKTMSSESVISEMKTLATRPATAREALAYVSAYPDKDVIALKQTWFPNDNGSGLVICLLSVSGGYDGSLLWSDTDWSSSCPFLVVCE